MNPDSGNGKQGLATANNPKVGYFEYDGQTQPSLADAYFLLQWIAAKKDENKAYEAAKSKYETERAEYNSKLKAAQVVYGDPFKSVFPNAEEAKALAAIPKRPTPPAVPSAYKGPKIF